MVTRTAIAFALCGLTASTWVAAAAAQEPEEEPLGPQTVSEAELADERARMHFEAGRSHYIEGAYDRARTEFETAWELSRRPPLLLNLAATLERLGEHAEAVASLRRYLELEPDAPHRGIVERRIENLERLIAERGAPAQARPADGPSVPAASPEAPAPAAQATSPSGADEGLLIGAGVSLAIAGVGLVLTATFGGLALSEDQALSEGCGATVSCTDPEVADASTFVLLTDVSWIAAAGTGAIGVVLLAVALTSGGGEPGSASRPRVTPYADAQGAGVRIAGTF